MMVGVYERVFGMAKWFRAENSNTRRHLTEGSQYEFEMGFIKDFNDVMDKLDEVTRFMVKSVEEKCMNELKLLKVNLLQIPKEKYPRYKFEDAIKVVGKITGEDTSAWDDLTPEAEKQLCKYAREKYRSDFIFVTGFPKGAFYAYKDEKGVFHNFDLLCREAEIASGGRRIDDYNQLVAAIKAADMDPEDFSEYLSIFKYGMPPHGGFGLGFERFTMLALGLQNIREATLFPSDPNRIASQALPKKEVRGADVIKKEIKQLFVDNDLQFKVIKHKPTPTSKEAASVRGLDLATGVKALILRDKKSGEDLMVCIPADKKLDMKKITEEYQKEHEGAKLEFQKPEVIKERYGLEVGGVPPIGHVFGVKTYFDETIFAQEIAAFNNSDQCESLICESKNLRDIIEAKFGDFIA
jgi:nondiscriminating aspartyl-tRNA synthetase